MATLSRRPSRENKRSPPKSPKHPSLSSSSLSLSPGKTSPGKRGSREKKSPGGLEGKEEEKEDERKVKLISKDGEEFKVPLSYAVKTSIFLETTLDADPDETEIPVPAVTSRILALVVKYMNHHKGKEPPLIEKPLRSRFMIEICKDPWDADFIDRIGEDRKDLYDLMLAANYMDMQPLLYIGAAKTATLVKGQPLDKIKSQLAINRRPEGKEEENPESKEEKKKKTSPNPGAKKKVKRGSR